MLSDRGDVEVDGETGKMGGDIQKFGGLCGSDEKS